MGVGVRAHHVFEGQRSCRGVTSIHAPVTAIGYGTAHTWSRRTYVVVRQGWCRSSRPLVLRSSISSVQRHRRGPCSGFHAKRRSPCPLNLRPIFSAVLESWPVALTGSGRPPLNVWAVVVRLVRVPSAGVPGRSTWPCLGPATLASPTPTVGISTPKDTDGAPNRGTRRARSPTVDSAPRW